MSALCIDTRRNPNVVFYIGDDSSSSASATSWEYSTIYKCTTPRYFNEDGFTGDKFEEDAMPQEISLPIQEVLVGKPIKVEIEEMKPLFAYTFFDTPPCSPISLSLSLSPSASPTALRTSTDATIFRQDLVHPQKDENIDFEETIDRIVNSEVQENSSTRLFDIIHSFPTERATHKCDSFCRAIPRYENVEVWKDCVTYEYEDLRKQQKKKERTNVILKKLKQTKTQIKGNIPKFSNFQIHLHSLVKMIPSL